MIYQIMSVKLTLIILGQNIFYMLYNMFSLSYLDINFVINSSYASPCRP